MNRVKWRSMRVGFACAAALTSTLALTGSSLAATHASSHAAKSAKDLKIYYIDVEGGASTLYVTPQGHTLLIDTGWPAGMGGPKLGPNDPQPKPTPSSAQRIAAQLKTLGLKKIDYLLMSHYHIDHLGGALELMKLEPIGTFIDHGPNREMPRPNATPQQLANSTQANYEKYLAAIADKPHIVMAPGQTLKIDDLSLTAVNADGKVIDHPLDPSAGPGAQCDKATSNDNTGGEENVRSVGVVMTWGRARVMALADTVWNVENRLVCPTNLIGKIDLMLIDNHGTSNANSPTLLNSVAPSVVVFDNGPTKGADGAVLHEINNSPSVRGVWQLHFATRSPEDNTAPDHIVNVLGDDPIDPLIIDVNKSGTVTVVNPRNGYSQSYKQADKGPAANEPSSTH
ncbi:MAG TPA: MBL fold metallo-hydrolase [Caulobacteraceae bacterium]|nr:MBL fold metallo-hydrolase [Caulobacteraceae bacterium]